MATVAAHLRQWWGQWRAPARRSALRHSWAGALARILHREKKHPFDHAHRVDTDGLIYADPAAQGHAGGRHNAGYYATAPSLFHGAIELWRGTLPRSGHSLEDYALVDIGCGKGRVLMLASGYRFREVLGVELDSQLARIARKNLRSWRIRRRASTFVRGAIRVIEGDALTLPLPDGPVALFYFNSFEREMMEMWLARLGAIATQRTHPLDLIYIHPEFDALVRQLPGVRVLADAEIPFSPEDAAADAFQVAIDRCVVYRIADPNHARNPNSRTA